MGLALDVQRYLANEVISARPPSKLYKLQKIVLRNKLLFILPVALLLSAIAPTVVEVILMFGGCFLAYEGAHKILHALRHDDHDHDVPAVVEGGDVESTTVSSAIRTDFIMSAEIMVISLKEVIDEPLLARGADALSKRFKQG